MTHAFLRSTTLAAVSLCAASIACSSDHNRPTNTADSAPEASSPMTPTPSSDATSAPGITSSTTPSVDQGNLDRSQGNQLGTTSGGTAVVGPRLSQAQVAMITELANTSEIEQGKIAQAKAKSPAVKKFAAMMIKHHTEAKNEQAKLYKQLSLTPTQSQQATALKEDGDRSLGSLKAASGAAFDLAYIEGQVAAHQKVLDSINQELIPAAADQQLLEGLNKMKSTVEAHLNEAKTIQADLQKTGGTGSTGSGAAAGSAAAGTTGSGSR